MCGSIDNTHRILYPPNLPWFSVGPDPRERSKRRNRPIRTWRRADVNVGDFIDTLCNSPKS